MACVIRLGDRVAEISWVLDHGADLDADFLAIYGIDLAAYDITGPRYFSLAHRLPAYQGVMAARVEEEREDTGTGDSPAPAAAEGPVRQSGGSKNEVSLTAFRVQFPGLVSMANG